jgi:hypothetical protein
MKNGKRPAFQSSIALASDEIKELGLTKREYFAGIALQGILSNHGVQTDTSDFTKVAIQLADELLKQLEA